MTARLQALQSLLIISDSQHVLQSHLDFESPENTLPVRVCLPGQPKCSLPLTVMCVCMLLLLLVGAAKETCWNGKVSLPFQQALGGFTGASSMHYYTLHRHIHYAGSKTQRQLCLHRGNFAY